MKRAFFLLSMTAYSFMLAAGPRLDIHDYHRGGGGGVLGAVALCVVLLILFLKGGNKHE